MLTRGVGGHTERTDEDGDAEIPTWWWVCHRTAARVKPAREGKADSDGQSGAAHRSERRVTAPPGFLVARALRTDAPSLIASTRRNKRSNYYHNISLTNLSRKRHAAYEKRYTLISRLIR